METELQALQAQIQRLTALHGSAAVQSVLAAGFTGVMAVETAEDPPAAARARRSRPPVRYSPEAERGARCGRRRSRSPQRGSSARRRSEASATPSSGKRRQVRGTPASRVQRSATVSSNADAQAQPSAATPEPVGSPALARRGRRTAPQRELPGPSSVRGAERAGHEGRSPGSDARHSSGARRVRSRARMDDVRGSQLDVGLPRSPAVRSSQGSVRGRSRSRSARSRSMTRSPASSEAVTEELEDGECRSPEASEQDQGSAAVPGSSRGQPGENPSLCVTSNVLPLYNAVGQGPGGASGGPGARGDTVALMSQFVTMLQGLLGGASSGAAPLSPVSAWTGGVATPTGGTPEVVEASAAGGASGTPSGEKEKEAGSKRADGDGLRLDDRAKGEVYVCFEGPLGAHLKQEVRDKIWKGEYVEIFSLLPLEKFHLDKIKPDESKKDEEEKRRYRLIPRTFSNWLQAFAILASVVGEKEPEHCSALFCYMDSVGEAYRTYGGQSWLRYDEQFRQRKAVRPGIRWDHKDIALWMKLMAAPAAQPFRGGAGGSGSSAGSSASQKKGYCWLL